MRYHLYAGADVDKGMPSLGTETGALPDDCRFLILTTSTGDYRITSRFTSPMWAMTAGRTSSSTVETYTYTAVPDQQWYFQKYTLSLSASNEMLTRQTMLISPSTTALPLTWSSSDSSIAMVSGGLVYARTPGTVTITATASNGVKANYSITVIDHRTKVLRSLTKNEIYYLYSPKTKMVQSELPIETRLDFIEIFKKYDEDTIDIAKLNAELKSSLNADFPLWFTQNLWSEYVLGSKGMFTPEMQDKLTQQYLETLRQFIVIVGFDCAARLSPFDAAGNIKYNATKEEIQADFAHALTNNPSSNKVMLGSTYGGVKYHVVASENNMTYFYSAYYEQLEAKYGPNYMRAINRQFLAEQTALGKEIWFSHNPANLKPDTGFEMEVNWLKQYYGITDFNATNLQKVGDLWKLVP